MRLIWNLGFMLVVAAMGHGAALAETTAESEVRAAGESYAEAMNHRDVAKVMTFWSKDAEYVDEQGRRTRGRAALEKLFREQLAQLPDHKFLFHVVTLRAIAANVVVEDGVAMIQSSDEPPGNRYTVVWVRADDGWQISSVHDLGPDLGGTGGSAAPLDQLDWLVGDWTAEVRGAKVHMSCSRVLDDKFLYEKYTVEAPGGRGVTVYLMIGWDPVHEELRSWMFDSRGGFGDGRWTREGGRWTIKAAGALADGRVGQATNVLTRVDQDTITWESTHRTVDGLPAPDGKVTFKRSASAPISAKQAK